MTTKGMSLLARGSKGNWELLASILVVGKRILPLEPLANNASFYPNYVWNESGDTFHLFITY